MQRSPELKAKAGRPPLSPLLVRRQTSTYSQADSYMTPKADKERHEGSFRSTRSENPDTLNALIHVMDPDDRSNKHPQGRGRSFSSTAIHPSQVPHEARGPDTPLHASPSSSALFTSSRSNRSSHSHRGSKSRDVHSAESPNNDLPAGSRTRRFRPEDLAQPEAGVKMAKAASGSRLKADGAYKKRDSVTNWVAPVPALSQSRRSSTAYSYGGRGMGTEGEGAEGDISSSDGSFCGDCVQWCKEMMRRRVPLWVQVLTLVCIPIIFLVVYQSIAFHKALNRLKFIESNDDVLELMFSCDLVMQVERGTSSDFLIAIPNSTDASAAYAKVLSARGKTDASCKRLSVVSQESAEPTIAAQYSKLVLRGLSAIAVLRYRVDTGTIEPVDQRSEYKTVVSSIETGMLFLAKETDTNQVQLMQLNELRAAANRLGMCRAIGSHITKVGQFDTMKLKLDFTGNCFEANRRHMKEFTEIARDAASDALYYWRVAPDALAAVQLLEDVNTLAHEPLGTLGNFTWTQQEWTTAFSKAIAVTEDMSSVILQGIIEAKKESLMAVQEGLKLFLSMTASLVGAVFVARAQRAGTKRVEFALLQTRRMTLAVDAFIPKHFLHMMGATLETMRRGDQSVSTVTLLSSDLRSFGKLISGMSNEELFLWIQGHLTRMASVVEQHGGFIDKFVGDMVCGVFASSKDAMNCSLSMHLSVEEQWTDMVCHNSDIRVSIAVGIHRCEVSCGILGNDKHNTCMLVSPEIMVPTQLEALTKEYGARIMCTQAVLDDIPEEEGHFSVRRIGKIALDGNKEYVVYEIFQADEHRLKKFKEGTVDEFEGAVAAKEDGSTEEARMILEELDAQMTVNHVHDAAVAVKLRNIDKVADQFTRQSLQKQTVTAPPSRHGSKSSLSEGRAAAPSFVSRLSLSLPSAELPEHSADVAQRK